MELTKSASLFQKWEETYRQTLKEMEKALKQDTAYQSREEGTLHRGRK